MLRRLFLPLMFGLIGTGILVSLGIWQLQRLEWKQAILSDISTRIDASPVALPEQPDVERDKYLPVTLRGRIADDEIHVLVSQKQVGAGYRIIAAFETDDGRRILLDRGFVKVDQKSASRPVGIAEITGNLHWPQETGSSIPEPDIAANIWFARDVPALAKALDTEPIMVIARTTSLANDPVTPLPVDIAGIPNDHLQYAVTWFSLAVIWLIMTFTFLWRGRTAQKG